MLQAKRIQEAVTTILEAIGDNPLREGLQDTPQRVANMYADLFSGVGVDPVEAIDAIFEEERHEEVITVKDVPFFSMCEHHLLPFFGVAHMSYIPNGKIAGISKLVRALEVVSHRLQVQERMTYQLADAIYKALTPDGVAVVIEAEHLCMTMRGVKKKGSLIVTSATQGPFSTEVISRGGLLSLLQKR